MKSSREVENPAINIELIAGFFMVNISIKLSLHFQLMMFCMSYQ